MAPRLGTNGVAFLDAVFDSETYSALVGQIPTQVDPPSLGASDNHASGDWVGVAPAGGELVRLIQADLEGKGHGARPYHEFLGSQLQRFPAIPPADWILNVDRHWPGERLATLAVVDLDLVRHRIRIALAGHPAPLIRGRSGAVKACREYGRFGVLGIGLNRDATEVPWLPFTPGSLLVLATDGVFDAGVGRGELFGSDRLMSAIETADEPCEVMEVVCRQVFQHLDGHPLEDDLTLLVIARSRLRSPALVQGLRATGSRHG
jgi:hypothetical protein